jgi:hypothetical protein
MVCNTLQMNWKYQPGFILSLEEEAQRNLAVVRLWLSAHAVQEVPFSALASEPVSLQPLGCG